MMVMRKPWSCFCGVAAMLVLAICVSFAAAQTPVLDGIAHIAFRVADLQASRAFYGKLGFEQAFVLSNAAASTEAFIKINDRQFLELYARTKDSQQPGLMHFCFESGDLELLNHEYLARGLEPTPVKKAGAGNLLFTLRGPEDENIEFTQYMPGSKHSEDRGKHLGRDRISEQLIAGSLIVRDPAAARQFYTSKLGFTAGADGELILPGSSGEAIELESARLSARAHLVFKVADLKRAAKELKSRGLPVQLSHAAVSVTGPDGAVIVFRAR